MKRSTFGALTLAATATLAIPNCRRGEPWRYRQIRAVMADGSAAPEWTRGFVDRMIATGTELARTRPDMPIAPGTYDDPTLLLKWARVKRYRTDYGDEVSYSIRQAGPMPRAWAELACYHDPRRCFFTVIPTHDGREEIPWTYVFSTYYISGPAEQEREMIAALANGDLKFKGNRPYASA